MPHLSALRPWQQALLVALVFVLLSVAATWPAATDPAHLSVVRPTENDYRFNLFLVFWGAHALLNEPLNIHHTNMFHPERYTYVYADVLLAHSLLMLPVIEAFYNPILTYNVFLILSLTINGTGFFLLARSVTGHAGAALFGAVCWAFNPAYFPRYQQIQLFGVHWLPWLAWALWHWLSPRDQQPDQARSSRWAVATTVFFCLNALSGSHIAVFGGMLAASMIIYFTVARGLWRDRRFVGGTIAMTVVIVALLAPVLWPYLPLEQVMAAKRGETLNISNSSLRPLEFFSAGSHFYRWLDARFGWPSVLGGGREPETYGFPGIVTLALALVGMVWPAGKRRADRNFWVLCAALFVSLALGVYGTYPLLGKLPVLRLIRVPTRFMLPAVFCLAVLASFGVAKLVERIVNRNARVALFSGLALLFAVEASHAPLPTFPYDNAPQPLEQFLAEQPGAFAIVEFPLEPRSVSINARQVFTSIFHWKKILVGYSGWQSDENLRLVAGIRDRFPSDECLDDLVRLDVRFVIVRRDRLETSFLEAVARQPRLRPALVIDETVVYRLQ
ncbi:MAG: hypothetical protein IH849_04435 [Acidobacteria bacterium]|nr:hypothetical protein [Acidobacteriota bacterium]